MSDRIEKLVSVIRGDLTDPGAEHLYEALDALSELAEIARSAYIPDEGIGHQLDALEWVCFKDDTVLQGFDSTGSLVHAIDAETVEAATWLRSRLNGMRSTCGR